MYIFIHVDEPDQLGRVLNTCKYNVELAVIYIYMNFLVVISEGITVKAWCILHNRISIN